MTTPLRAATVTGQDDFSTRVDRQRRVRELKELAAAEGIRLPLPAKWIAALESKGIMVDLLTGDWVTDDLRYEPTMQALTGGGER